MLVKSANYNNLDILCRPRESILQERLDALENNMNEGLVAIMLMFLEKLMVIVSNKTAYCCKISVKKVKAIEKDRVMAMPFFCCMTLFPLCHLRILLFLNLLFTENKGNLCYISVSMSKGSNLLSLFLVDIKNLDMCLYMNHIKLVWFLV